MPIWGWWRRERVPMALVCYTRADCSLCHQAERALERLAARGAVTVEYRSIANDPALTAAYGTRIPVVCLGDEVLAEGKISEVWLGRQLAARRRASGG